MRGGEHIADCQKKTAEKPLWKHIQDKHQGRMEFQIFEHFKMTQTGIYFKPQRRKANEGVRISHLNPDTRMNSKDEFRQGTNISMRALAVLSQVIQNNMESLVGEEWSSIAVLSHSEEVSSSSGIPTRSSRP